MRRVYLLHYPTSETKTYSLVLMCYLTPKPSPPFDPIRKKHSLTITPQSRMLPDDQPSWKHGHFSCQTSNRNPRLVITLFHLPLFLSESWKIVASGKNVANTWFGAFRHFFEKKRMKKVSSLYIHVLLSVHSDWLVISFPTALLYLLDWLIDSRQRKNRISPPNTLARPGVLKKSN